MTIKQGFSYLIIIAILLSFTFSSFASDPLVTLDNISNKQVGDTVTLSGTNSMGTISLKVIRPDSTVLYLNTVSTTNYSDTFTIPLDAAIGKYTVVAGVGTTVATKTFNVVAPPVPVTEVTLNKTTLSLVSGTKGFLTATVLPTNAANKTVTFSSDEPSVATVDNAGVVSAVAPGTATITVTTVDGGKTATCSVTVTAAPASVTIDKITDKKPGETVTVTGTNNLGSISIKVIRPDTTVLYINTITATNYSDTFTIPSDAAYGKYTVVAGLGADTATTTFNVVAPVSEVTLNKTTLSLVEGAKGFLTATVLPTNAANKTVTYSSDEPSVATVDNAGVVSAVAPGTATITVTTADGGKTATCIVTVTAAPTSVTIDNITDKKPGETVTVTGTNNLGSISIKVIRPDTTVLYINTITATNYSDTFTIPSDAAYGKYTVVVGQGTDTATTTFNVVNPSVLVTEVTLNKTTLSLVSGTKGFLTATVLPTNAANKAVTYSSDKPSVATVDNAGVVSAVAPGTATITVTTADGGKTATCIVTVTAASTSITVNSISDKSPGDTVTVSGLNNLGTISIKVLRPDTTVLYLNTITATNYSDTFTIPSDAAYGKYTVVVGQGTDTATTTFNVVRPPVLVTEVTLNKTSLSLVEGAKGFLTATVLPTNATNKAVTFSSSHPSIATVDSAGVVSAVAPGTATITVTTADGGKTATCTVTVTATATSITVNNISDKKPGQTVTVSGLNNLGTITIKVIRPDTTVLYINTTSAKNYSDVFTIPSDAATGVYTVVVGQGSEVATTTFRVVTSSGGGSEGGGGSGSTTPTTPDQTSAVANGNITINIKPNANGFVDAKVADSDMEAAIGSAQNKTVNIQLKSASDAKNISVSISAQQVKKALDKNIETITVDTGLATITFASDLIKENMQHESDVLKLNISIVDNSTLSSEVQSIVNQNTVLDFTMMIGSRTISNFDNVGQVTVSMKYDLKPGENPDKVILYYINEDGKPEIVLNARYDQSTGMMTFKPNHFSKYAVVHSKVTFSDIDKPEWAKTYIEALAAREIVAGIGNNKFNPNGNVTRAEFIQMLVKAFELTDSTATTTFKDVKEGAWYYNSIATAQKLGIVKGKTDGNFGVTDLISRQDMAVMLYNTAKVAKISLESKNVTEFTDKADISAYAMEAVESVQKAGIVSGIGNGMYAPKNISTRAEAAKIIYSLFNMVK